MKTRKTAVVCLAFALAAGSAFAGGMPRGEAMTPEERRATGRGAGMADMDAGMRNDEEAQLQGQSRSDLEITARIRRSVVDQERLSMYAHNIKIYTHDGHVTLMGAVRTAREKQQVEQIAENVVGKGRVTNKVLIRPDVE